MKKIKTIKMVAITWIDSSTCVNTWESLGSLPAPKNSKCHTVGYLIKDTKKKKVVAQNIGDFKKGSETQILNVIVIPTVAVKSIKVLGEMK